MNESTPFTDDAAGQVLGGDSRVAREFLQAPEALEEHIIRAGSSATLEDIIGWQRTLLLGIKYRNATLVNNATYWFLATRGALGEANETTMITAIGGHAPDKAIGRAQTQPPGVKGWLKRRADNQPKTEQAKNGSYPE